VSPIFSTDIHIPYHSPVLLIWRFKVHAVTPDTESTSNSIISEAKKVVFAQFTLASLADDWFDKDGNYITQDDEAIEFEELDFEEALEIATKRMSVMGYFPWEIEEAAKGMLLRRKN